MYIVYREVGKRSDLSSMHKYHLWRAYYDVTRALPTIICGGEDKGGRAQGFLNGGGVMLEE